MYYVAILEGEADNWAVRIPDLKGCYGAGTSAEAALADATSAAREWASHQTMRGVEIPLPRAMREVASCPDAEFDAQTESLVMIPLLVDRSRPVRANISLDAGLLESIDQEAKRRGLTRSAFLASAAREKITQGR